MADFISREAAIAKILSEPPYARYPSEYAEKLKQIPAADVAEVVRCKDCVQYSTNTEWCNIWEYYLQTDFFCACGKRRAKNGD